MEVSEVLSQLKQFIGVGHRSRPPSGLLRLRQKVEVGKNSPFFERLHLLDDRLRNLPGERKKLCARYSIGENNLKEDSRFSVPIVAERWRHGNDVWLQGASRLGDGRKELRLMCESLRDVHEVIIAHLAAVCRNRVRIELQPPRFIEQSRVSRLRVVRTFLDAEDREIAVARRREVSRPIRPRGRQPAVDHYVTVRI